MDYVYNICQTCLSDGRQLYPLRVLRNLLPELECYFEEMKESIGGVCWECRSHILNFFKFKSNIRKAQNTMWNFKVNKQNGNLSSVSRLSVSHKQTYDYIYTFYEEMEIKTEPIFIKKETNISDCEMDDVKTDIDIDETINFEFVNTEVKETIQSDDGNVIVSKQEILDDIEITYLDGENNEQTKFSKVIFTQGEMQECREMKLSQPNFQALRLKCCDCVIGFERKDQYGLPMEKKHDWKMAAENQIDDKLKRKRELTNARVKKYRKKKRAESQQLNSLMQNNPAEEIQNKQVKENNAERKRAMAKERLRRFREMKRHNVVKSVHHVDHDSEIPGPSHGN